MPASQAAAYAARITVLLALALNHARADDPAHRTVAERSELLPALVAKMVQPLVDREWASGVVVGVLDEQGPRVFGYGRQAPEKPEPPDGESVFEIGSITKVFTSLLLADMIERGMVSLDDPVNKYLPAEIEPLRCSGREMRLIDLATHTSGLPRLPGNIKPEDLSMPYADYTAEKLHAFLKDHAKPSLAASIGKSLTGVLGIETKPAWAYSNLGVGLLGHLLERRAERSYEELIVERVCGPLQMQSTRLTPDEAMLARLVKGHDAEGNPVKNWKFGCLAPAGGVYSTANDMLRLMAAEMGLSSGPLDKAIARTQQPHFKVNDKLEMGLGWLLLSDSRVFHDGMTGGYASFACFSKSQKVGVVILADTAVGGEGGALNATGMALLKALIKKEAGVPPRVRAAIAVEPKVLEAYAGKYSLVPLVATITVTCEGDRLYAQLTGQQRFRIYPESEKEFFYKVVGAQITFERNDAGQVERLVLHQNGKDMPAGRMGE